MTNEEAIFQIGYLKDFKTSQQIEALDMAIKALEQRWIPCSEGLPEHNMLVLITVRRYDNEIVVRSGYYYSHGDDSIFHADNGNCWKIDDDGLLAWMPLPDPYKGVSENDSDEKL